MSALHAPVTAPTTMPQPCTTPGCVHCEGRLAEVIDLQARRPRTVVPRSVYWRRRAVAALIAALVVTGAVAGVSRLVAPMPAPVASGQTTLLEPGDTLWDVAVEHTAMGGDVRATLHQIQTLNGFTSATVPAWTVVHLPANG